MSREDAVLRLRKQDEHTELRAQDELKCKNNDNELSMNDINNELSMNSNVFNNVMMSCGNCLRALFVLLSLCLTVIWYLSGDFIWPVNMVVHFLNGIEHGEILKEKWENNSIWALHKRSSLSLNEFVEKYDGKRPVIITDVLSDWKSNNWSKEFFVKKYGDQQVLIKNVHGTLRQAEGLMLPLRTFAAHSDEGSPTRWSYLQDELFIQLNPELRNDLGQPVYLKEDFFQLFPAEVRPWNAMLLWGSAFSRSYLHIDPYNWTGTNAVLSGRKLWKLYPPGQDQYLYVIPNITSHFPLNCFKYNSPVDAFNPDLKKYPDFSKAKAISFAQNAGELLIIPPGWFHQAFNEVESIAVSSQVMNTQNFHIILEEIFKVGEIDQSQLPTNFKQLSPENQVLQMLKLLPAEIIEKGRTVTAEILKQIQPRQNINNKR